MTHRDARPASLVDLDRSPLTEGRTEALAAALADLHAGSQPAARPWSAADFAGTLAQTSVFCLTLDSGFALGRVILDEAEVLLIAVHQDAQRRGYATTLMSDFGAHAQNLGARTGFLDVAASNTAARSLYRRCGWTEHGRRKGYYSLPGGSKDDALLMRKHL